MRVLIAVVVALLVAIVLVLWFTHGATPAPIAPSSTPGSTLSASDLEARDRTLTPAAGADLPARVPKPTAPTSSSAAGPRCHVFGRVLDEHEAPLADVPISLYPVGGRWSETATLAKKGPPGSEHEALGTKTGSDGKFSFDAPVPTADWVVLDIQPDLYHAIANRNFGPAGGRNKPRLVAGDNDLGDIVLEPCGAVAGRVVSKDGRGLDSVRISSFEVTAQGAVSNTQTDSEGKFVLGHLPSRTRKIDVVCEGWIPQRDMSVDVTPSTTTHLADIVMQSAFAISGTVSDDEGKPLARIVVLGTQVAGRRDSTRSRDDGAFTLFVEKDAPCTLEVNTAKGYQPWGGGSDARFDAGTTGVRIVLQRSPGITFKVIDVHTREPIERFGLRLDPKPVSGRFATAVERDIPLEDHPGGEARMPASNAWVVACAPGHATLETEVLVDAGTKDTQTLALHPASSVRGRVILSGNSAASASITMVRESIDKDRTYKFEPGMMGSNITYDVGAYAGRKRTRACDAQGVFVVDDLALGTWMLQIDAPGAARKRFRGLAVPEENVLDLGDIVLDAGATIRGVLVSAAGESAQGFTVMLDHSLRRPPSSGQRVEIDNIDGKFEFTGLAAGAHEITWARSSQNTWSNDDPHEQSLELAAGETREIVLDASASVPCRVIVHLTRGGRPAPGIVVSMRIRSRVTPGSYRMSPIGTSGPDGTMAGEVDGDARFDLQATTADDNDLGDIATDVVAVPGGVIERTYALSIGRLIVELPAGFAIPESGMMRVTLTAPGREALSVNAMTAGAPQAYHGVTTWKDARIDFGEFPASTYTATVAIQSFEPDPERPKHPKQVDVRAPYKTTVTIEADHEAKIVVP